MATNTLILPKLHISYTSSLPQKQILLVSGGRPPQIDWLQEVSQHRILWCIDHGIDICRKALLHPQRLIGDGDSASKASWDWAKAMDIPIEKYSPKKNLTDTQLALQNIRKIQPCPFVVLSGALGNRFDHAFSTLHSFAAECMPGCIADEQETVLFLKGMDSITIETSVRPKAISLLPLTEECCDVSITNVFWPLDKVILKQSLPYAISNELMDTAHEFSVSISHGILAVYLYWE